MAGVYNFKEVGFRKKWDKNIALKNAVNPNISVNIPNLGTFGCTECSVSFTCSQLLLEHKSSKKHLARINLSAESKEVTAETIRERLERLKKGTMHEKKEKRKPKKLKLSVLKDQNNNESSSSVDPEMKLLGFDFDSFQSSKK